MIRFIFKLAVSLVILLLVYNYFFGTVEEKSNSKKIFGEVIHLGKSSWDLLRAEKQKLKEGKYDMAMDKVSQLLNSLESAVLKTGDPQLNDQFKELSEKRDQLQFLEKESKSSLNTVEDEAKANEEKLARLAMLKSLLSETENLMKQLENR